MYEFCNSVMFEATFLTLYGRPSSASRHSEMVVMRENFVRFDTMFPLLVAEVPIWLLRRTKAIREKLINYFLPHRMSCWLNTSHFIRRRLELLDQYDTLRDVDKAGRREIIKSFSNVSLLRPDLLLLLVDSAGLELCHPVSRV